jgi:hypothetical protein
MLDVDIACQLDGCLHMCRYRYRYALAALRHMSFHVCVRSCALSMPSCMSLQSSPGGHGHGRACFLGFYACLHNYSGTARLVAVACISSQACRLSHPQRTLHHQLNSPPCTLRSSLAGSRALRSLLLCNPVHTLAAASHARPACVPRRLHRIQFAFFLQHACMLMLSVA